MERRKVTNMGTIIRSELSENNPYWIEKHRYYELKHFCLQYPIWKKVYSSIGGTASPRITSIVRSKIDSTNDQTSKDAIAKIYFSNRINMLESVASRTDPVLASYLLKAITEGWSYDILKTRLEIPCGKDKYYELYRKFFWLLDQERQ